MYKVVSKIVNRLGLRGELLTCRLNNKMYEIVVKIYSNEQPPKNVLRQLEEEYISYLGDEIRSKKIPNRGHFGKFIGTEIMIQVHTKDREHWMTRVTNAVMNYR